VSIEDKHAAVIGKLALQVNQLSQHSEDLNAALGRSYELLAQCVRSEQCSAEQITKIMQDEVFNRWYLQRYPAPESKGAPA
jgi:hypothetical protein